MENLKILTTSSNHHIYSSRHKGFSKFSQNTLYSSHTPELTPTGQRSPSNPKKSRTPMLINEVQRLDEELNFNLLKLNSKLMNDSKLEKRRKKELKLHEVCLEGIIHCIQFFDAQIFRVLNRAWVGYQRISRQKEIKKESLGVYQSTNTKVLMSEVAVQTGFEADEVNNEEEYNEYINLINRAIYRIGGMNNNRIIKTLKKLLLSLNPIDVPSYSDPDTPTQKPNNSINLIDPIPVTTIGPGVMISKTKLGVINLSRAVQTINLYEGATVESLASLLVERDRQIYQLQDQVKQLKILEKKLETSENDLIITKNELKQLQGKECKNCLERLEKIKEDKNKIEDLKKNLEKTEVVQNELKQTKTRLRESVLVIGKSNEKILHLSENLDDLTEKIEEIRAERMKLEARLADEESLRVNLENRLKQELTKSFNSRQGSSKYAFSSIAEEQEEDNLLSTEYTNNKSQERSNHFEDYDLDIPISSKNSKSPVFGRRKFANNESFNVNKKKTTNINSNKKKSLFKVFNITKAEFLSMSNKARMELFECLYEHKDRCGTECEHLKRAMMIKLRERGQAFPVKKYNIVKS